MMEPLLCHMLIGPPGSGKTTLAQQMQQIIPDSRIVSTDQIRKSLYGNEANQGDWFEIEAVVIQRINAALDHDTSVIYDATNAKRIWRMGLLQKTGATRRRLDWLAVHNPSQNLPSLESVSSKSGR